MVLCNLCFIITLTYHHLLSLPPTTTHQPSSQFQCVVHPSHHDQASELRQRTTWTFPTSPRPTTSTTPASKTSSRKMKTKRPNRRSETAGFPSHLDWEKEENRGSPSGLVLGRKTPSPLGLDWGKGTSRSAPDQEKSPHLLLDLDPGRKVHSPSRQDQERRPTSPSGPDQGRRLVLHSVQGRGREVT